MKDIVFRGATRPPMFIGIPIMPLFIVFSVIALASIYFSLKIFFALIPAIVIMQAAIKVDDQIFNLLGLRILTGFRALANPRSGSGDRLIGPHVTRRANWF